MGIFKKAKYVAIIALMGGLFIYGMYNASTVVRADEPLTEGGQSSSSNEGGSTSTSNDSVSGNNVVEVKLSYEEIVKIETEKVIAQQKADTAADEAVINSTAITTPTAKIDPMSSLAKAIASPNTNVAIPEKLYDVSSMKTPVGYVKAFEKIVTTVVDTPGTTSDICLNVGGQNFVNKSLAETISSAKADIIVFVEYQGVVYKVTIPKGTDITGLLDENGYAGFLYIGLKTGHLQKVTY